MKMRWLLITAVLWTGRPPDGRLQDVLLQGSVSGRGYSYALATIGDNQARQVRPLRWDGHFYEGWSADGAFFFLAEPTGYPNDEEYKVYRVDWPAATLQLMDTAFPKPINILSWSPDRNWIIYLHRENSQFDLVARRVDDSQSIRLTDGQFNWADTYPDLNLAFSSDQQWVYFNGPVGQIQHLFRVKLDGSHLENLTPNATVDVPLLYAIPEHNIYLVYGQAFGHKSVGLIAPDGSSFLPFTTISPYQYPIGYLPKRRLLLLDTWDGMSAFAINDGIEHWRIRATQLSYLDIFVTADESTIYYFGSHRKSLERISWDGTGRTTLLTFTPEQHPLTFDPNEEILMYSEALSKTGPYEIWRQKLGETPQKIASFATLLTSRRYIPNQEWFVFQTLPQPDKAYIYRIRPDGTGLERILNGPSEWNDVVAFGPKWELKWQPLIHAIFGTALLMISCLRLPPKWRKSRRWPLLNSARRL